jgi:hypothetical protein
MAKRISQQCSIVHQIEHGTAHTSAPSCCRHSSNKPLNAWVLKLPLPADLQSMAQAPFGILSSLSPDAKAGGHQLDRSFECCDLPTLIQQIG